ncbi:MAG: hypothetical protein PVG32_02190 [Anaerolineales bacterium]|jgi:hypothetical protein
MNANSLSALSHRIRLQRGVMFGLLIIAALFAFETFNYSTTDFALSDLLGELKFLGVRWATILAIAFCGIDFAGIARLFTPEQGSDEPAEVWYLFGAWLLAATMNATLTWWGVSIAILNHETLGNAVVERALLLKVVPIFVAVMVWLIRVLIIGTISVAGDRLFSQSDIHIRRQRPTKKSYTQRRSPVRTLSGRPSTKNRTANASSIRPAPKPNPSEGSNTGYNRPEPTYHPITAAPRKPRNPNSNQSSRQARF